MNVTSLEELVLLGAAFAKHDDIVYTIVSHAQQLKINLDFKDDDGRTGLGMYFREV